MTGRALIALLVLAGPVAAQTTVVSYNIHAGTDAAGEGNLGRVAAVVEAVGADIALLQEVDRGTRRSGGADQLDALQRRTGFHGAFARSLDFQGGAYGIALLSRWPIASAETVALPADPPQERAGSAYEPRVALHAVVETPDGPLHVVNTHLGAGAAGTYRRQELVTLLAAIRRRVPETARLVVGGDFNAVPASDEYGAVTLALHDAWELCGTGSGYTYPAGAPARRIDYVFLRGAECTEARVHPGLASDHQALVVRLAAR